MRAFFFGALFMTLALTPLTVQPQNTRMLRIPAHLAWEQLVGGEGLIGQTTLLSIDDGPAVPQIERTCTPTSEPDRFLCQIPLPAMTPGFHRLTVTTRTLVNPMVRPLMDSSTIALTYIPSTELKEVP